MVETLAIDLEQARFKAAETVSTGLRTLEFYAAAFSKTPDKNGDIIDSHAFDDWLQEFYAAGKPLSISFSHAAVLDGTDPTNVIGYAPADPEHVWVDDYGLRIRGFIDVSTEKGKAVEWQIENKLIGGASIAYQVPAGGRVKSAGGSKVMRASVREAGPTPNPANQEAVLLWLKAEHMTEEPADEPYMTVQEFRTMFLKTVDTSTWEGNTAMTACSTAAQYGEICAAEHTIGQTDERQHWAGPHHYLGKGPNQGGVQAALGRWGTSLGNSQVKNISQDEWSSGLGHLRAHAKEINPDYQPPSTASEHDEEMQGLGSVVQDAVPFQGIDMKHAAAGSKIQAAHDILVQSGAKCAAGAEQVSTEDPHSPTAILRRMRFLKTSLT